MTIDCVSYNHGTKLYSTVLKMPEQHFLVVYPWRSGQHFLFEQIRLALVLLQHQLLFII